MSGLPKQVTEAVELAEQLHERMFTPDSEVTQEEQPAEAAEEESETPATETQPEQEEDESFKNRYLSLKGKYDAEVPRLHQELKDLKERVFAQIGDLTKPKEEPKADPVADQLSKYREEYGEDLLEMARLIARKEIEQGLKAHLEPVQKQVEDVSETQIKAAQENFKNYLTGKVEGDWQALWKGQDPKFLEFLDQPDPSGLYTYGQLAQLYNDNWDADKLAIVFNTYLKSQAKPEKQEVTKPPVHNPAQDAIVAPSRATTNTVPASTDAKIWTQEMIAEFKKNDRMGKYDGETSMAMWDDLLKAIAENRIR